MSPSIRSKLPQKLFRGFTPKISAIVITNRKTKIVPDSQLSLGRYFFSTIINKTQIPANNSIIIRKMKAFPVIKGKANDPIFTRAMNGIKKIPKISNFRSKSLFIRIGVTTTRSLSS